MLCPQCGAENRRGAKYCEACGASLPKRRKKVLPILLAAAAALAAAGVVVALNFAVVSNFVMRSFASPERYYQFAMARSAAAFAEALSESLSAGQGLDIDPEDFGESVTLDFTISDEALELAAGYFGLSDSLGGELSWLKSPSLRLDVRRQGYLAALELGLELEDKAVLEAGLTVDGEAERLWAAVPQLNDTALELDASEGFGQLRESGSSARELFDSISTALDEMPDKALLRRVAARYFLLLTEDLGVYEKGKGSLSVGEVSAPNYGWLRLEIGEDNLRALATRLCAALREDSEVRSLVEDYGAMSGRKGFYARFLDALDRLEEQGARVRLDEDIRLFLWVNNRGVLRGFEYSYLDTSLLLRAPSSGSRFGLLAGYTGGGTDLSFSGTGEKDGERLSGSFTLGRDAEELLVLELRDVRSGADRAAGSFTLRPAMELYRSFGISATQARYLENLSLNGTFSRETNDFSAQLGLLWQDTAQYLGLDCALTAGPSGGLASPRDAAGLPEWFGGVTAEKIASWADTLKAAGVPGKLAEQLQAMLAYLAWFNA